MNRTVVEKNLVVVLFILVLIAFSFAEKESKKLVPLYAPKSESFSVPQAKERNLAAEDLSPKPDGIRFFPN